MSSFDKKLRIIETLTFFAAWNVIFLLGADFPPPVGFLWLVLLVFVLDIFQFFYLGYLLPNIGRTPTFVLNLLFFLAGGLFVSLISTFLQHHIELVSKAIWITAVTAVSSLYGIILWVANWWIKRAAK